MPADQVDRPTSPLRQARREPGWSGQEVVDKVHAICSGQSDDECHLNVVKLHHYEDGTRHPGPNHVSALCRLFEKTPEELGLTI